MALWDEVTSRYGNTMLVQLTNVGNTLGSTSIDTTRADAAVADVIGDFSTYAQQAYDNADAQHVAVAVEAVIARLEMLGSDGGSIARKRYTEVQKRMGDLAAVTVRARIQPRTKSTATPTQDRPGDLPDFDRKRFGGYRPQYPYGRDLDEPEVGP